MLLAACGGGDGGASPPGSSTAAEVATTAAATTTEVDPALETAASEVVELLDELETKVSEVRSDCDAMASTSRVDRSLALGCGLGTLSLTWSAQTVGLKLNMLDDDMADELPQELRSTRDLVDEIDRLWDAHGTCEDERKLGLQCGKERDEALRTTDRLVARKPAWQRYLRTTEDTTDATTPTQPPTTLRTATTAPPTTTTAATTTATTQPPATTTAAPITDGPPTSPGGTANPRFPLPPELYDQEQDLLGYSRSVRPGEEAVDIQCDVGGVNENSIITWRCHFFYADGYFIEFDYFRAGDGDWLIANQSAGGGTGAGAELDPFCTANDEMETLIDGLDGSTLEDVREGAAQIVEAADELSAYAPEEIVYDVESLTEGFRQFKEIADGAATLEASQAEARAVSEDLGLDAAGSRISAWVDSNC